jgi:dethiobiotin synthetase
MNKKQGGFFITGTDTGVGKTLISIALLLLLKKHGFKTAAIKPVASGCIQTFQGIRNADANLLQFYATEKFPYNKVNPFAFFKPIAPHIAAQKTNQPFNVKNILANCMDILKSSADYKIVEGVGGWLVPLNSKETMANLAIEIGFPIILVVGLRLGCLNHALLTLANIQSTPLFLAGWVANIITPEMLVIAENIQTLTNAISAPLLGVISHQKLLNYQQAASLLEEKFLNILM